MNIIELSKIMASCQRAVNHRCVNTLISQVQAKWWGELLKSLQYAYATMLYIVLLHKLAPESEMPLL